MEAITACGRGGSLCGLGTGAAVRNWIAGIAVAALTISVVATSVAQEEPPDPTPAPTPAPAPVTANVEVRVWQDVDDALRIYVSGRPEDGDWGVLGTIPLALDDGHSSSGRFRYGDITVGVSVAASPSAPATSPTPPPTRTPWVAPRPDNTYMLRDLAAMPAPVAPQPPPRPDPVMTVTLYNIFRVSYG